MQFLPQQQPYGALPGQCQQCFLSPGYSQGQQQPSPYGGLYPQQYYQNPYQQQQYYYPQQQQQQQFPFLPQAQAMFYPQQQQQQQQQYPFYQQQQQQYPYYPQQQQQQQQWPNWAQGPLGQSAAGYQQYWPQQHRVYEDPSSARPSPRHEKEKPKQVYERYYQ